MDRQHQKQRSFQFMIHLVIFFSLVLSATSCGPTREERQPKEEARKELEAKTKRISDQISEKYDSIYFPPQNFGAATFTYELQKFFDKYRERAVLFRGYFEDVQKAEGGIVIDFLCPLGEHFFINKTSVRFRLTASESKVTQFLETKRVDPMLGSLRYFLRPKYFIVARVNNLKRIRRFEFHGSVQGEEVEIDVDVLPGFVSTGILIDAVSIPED